jgi:hypothetical protein
MTMSGIFLESAKESERLVGKPRFAVRPQLKKASAKVNAERSWRDAEMAANLAVVLALNSQAEDFGRTLWKPQLCNDQKPLHPRE